MPYSTVVQYAPSSTNCQLFPKEIVGVSGGVCAVALSFAFWCFCLRPRLVSMCKYMGLQTFGTDAYPALHPACASRLVRKPP